MKYSRWQLLSFLTVLIFAILLASVLYRINISSPRIDLAALAELEAVPEGGPFLLEGGQIAEAADGTAVFLLSFHYDGEGLLYFPRTDSAMINGNQSTEGMYRGYVAQLAADESNNGNYNVEIKAERGYLSPTTCSVYFGTERQISDFISNSLEGNAYLQGFCFAIVLLSLHVQAERKVFDLAGSAGLFPRQLSPAEFSAGCSHADSRNLIFVCVHRVSCFI